MSFIVPTPTADDLQRVVAEVALPGAIEPKVRAATAAASTAAGVLVPAVLWLIGRLLGADVPVAFEGLIGLLITGVCTFAAGYAARHVDRVRLAG